MTVHDTQNPESREDALAAAVDAVRGGDLIVLPTDTVYGIGADAFSPDAVEALLEAKGRGRDTPPPVLIGDHAVLLALAADLPDYVEDLTEELWPGALTLILTAQRSLTWDLGETRGTVALRMPENEVALELLRRTGPLAVSSANRHGKPAAKSVLDAATQLGDSVEVYLDGGPARIGASSTILDTTVTPAEIVREGAVTKEQIIAVVGDIFTAPAPEATDETDAAAADVADADTADADGSASAGTSADDTSAAATSTDAAETATDEGSAVLAEEALEAPTAPGTGDTAAPGSTAPDSSADDSAAPDSTAPDSTAPGSAAAESDATTSVLDLPSEPAAGTDEAPGAPAETALAGIGEPSPAPDARPEGSGDGSESTTG